MKRKIKVWNRALLLIAITIVMLGITAAYIITQANDNHLDPDTQVPDNKPEHTTPSTPPEETTEPQKTQITIESTQEWIQGNKDQTTYEQQKLKLAQHSTNTAKQREELERHPYKIENANEHIILAKDGKIQTQNQELEPQDSYTYFERGFTSLQTQDNTLYAAEIIFQDREQNETLHIIDIEEDGNLNHQLSQETNKDITNFKPLDQNDKFFISEFQNQTHIYQKEDDELVQKETLEIEADFYDQVITTTQDNTYLIGQEFDQEQKTLIKINNNGLELENKTKIQDLTKDHHVTGIQKISEQKFAITAGNMLKIVEKDYAGNNTYKYKTQDTQYFNQEPIQMNYQENQITVASNQKTQVYNIEDGELEEKWSLERPEETTPIGITKINENIYTAYRGEGNTPSTIENQEENYQSFRYYQEGRYTSQVFDLGTSQNINNGLLRMQDNNQPVQLTVEAADNNNFQNSEEQTITASGTLQTLASLDINGQYVRITLDLESNTWQTPEIEEIRLDAN